MKRFVLCLLAILLFFGTGIACLASSLPYVGNETTKVYHMVECTWAQKIDFGNRVYFISRESAENHGYRRCHYCGDGVIENGSGGGHSDNKKPTSNSIAADIDVTSKTDDTSNGVHPLFWVAVGSLLVWFVYGRIKGISAKQKQQPKSQANVRKEPIKMPTTLHKTSIPEGVVPVKLNSSFIASAAYSEQYLYLTFTNGQQLTYYQVPPFVFDELIRAESPGQYFHAKIRNTYPYM